MLLHEHRHSFIGAPFSRESTHSCAHLAVAHHTRKTHTFAGIMHAGPSLLAGIVSSSSTTVPDYMFVSALGYHLAHVNHASGRGFGAAAWYHRDLDTMQARPTLAQDALHRQRAHCTHRGRQSIPNLGHQDFHFLVRVCCATEKPRSTSTHAGSRRSSTCSRLNHPTKKVMGLPGCVY